MATQKTFTVEKTNLRTDVTSKFTGTIPELVQVFKCTLEAGQRGKKKINTNPKNINALIKNLNDAISNCAANGYSNYLYEEYVE